MLSLSRFDSPVNCLSGERLGREPLAIPSCYTERYCCLALSILYISFYAWRKRAPLKFWRTSGSLTLEGNLEALVIEPPIAAPYVTRSLLADGNSFLLLSDCIETTLVPSPRCIAARLLPSKCTSFDLSLCESFSLALSCTFELFIISFRT